MSTRPIMPTPTTQTTQTRKPQWAAITSTPTAVNEAVNYEDRDQLHTDAKLLYMGIKNFVRDPQNVKHLIQNQQHYSFNPDGSYPMHSSALMLPHLGVDKDIQRKYKNIWLHIGPPHEFDPGRFTVGNVNPRTDQQSAAISHAVSVITRGKPQWNLHLQTVGALHPQFANRGLSWIHNRVNQQLSNPESYETFLHEFTHGHQFALRGARFKGEDSGGFTSSYLTDPKEREAFGNEIKHRLRRASIGTKPDPKQWLHQLSDDHLDFLAANPDKEIRQDITDYVLNKRRG